MINILCPTKSRPKAVEEVYESWKITTDGKNSQLIFIIDPESLLTYPTGYNYFHSSIDSRGMVKALNEASIYYTNGHNMFIGDDHRFRSIGWDTIFNDLCEDTYAILYGDDLYQGAKLPTEACLSRKMVNALGGIMCLNALKHLFVDNYWLTLGNDTQTISYVPEVVIEHCHPCIGKGEWDAQYNTLNSQEYWNPDQKALSDYLGSAEYTALVEVIKCKR